MRTWFFLLAGLVLAAAPKAVWPGDGSGFDWDQWRYLPVQDGGREKPLDTLASEACRALCNQTRPADPASGETLEATTLYLVMLLEWQGWDQPAAARANPHAVGHPPTAGSYDRGHRPDKWDQAPLLRVDSRALRAALGTPRHEAYISPVALSQAKIRRKESGDERPFIHWAEGLARQEQDGLTEFERKGLELAHKFRAYQGHRMGKRLAIVPILGSEDQPWGTVSDLMSTEWDEKSDPTGLMRQARQQFHTARAAYLRNSPAEFNQASAAFLAAVGQLGPKLGAYPPPAKIRLEVAYNHFAPFRLAWVLTSLSLLCLLLSLGVRWKLFLLAGWAMFVGGLAAMSVGFVLRVVISGRAPVTNMYESVVYVGFGVAVLGIALELIHRRRLVLTAAAGMATIALVLADNCPAVLDGSLQPLQPVLRSNFWLVTHVMTITLSYAALALALGIGNITLGYYLVGSEDQPTIGDLSDATYRALQVGVLLLAIGTILGGVWADYTWGRFWGWDPKEVWALVALLGYLSVLHARFAGWVREFGLAALSVMCFSLVVMAWYGVNFVLGAGLHSYGFGGGGQMYVCGAIGLQAMYVAAAAFQSFRHGVSRAASESNATT